LLKYTYTLLILDAFLFAEKNVRPNSPCNEDTGATASELRED
jgi:hypothetical protein